MSNLKKEILSGAFYIGVARYSGILFQIFISAILARLLPPSDFGIIAIATVVMAFFNLLSDIGISSAIIQKKDLGREDFDQIYTFTLYLGVILASIFFFCSWPISLFYEDEQLLPICQLMSSLLFLSCVRIVPTSLILRNKEFKYQSITLFISNVIGGVIACLAAYSGLGVYSLVVSFFIPSILVFTSFYHRYPVRFRIRLDINPMKRIFSYSIYVFLFNLVNYFSRNLDKLLVGKYVSLSDLGQYQKSYNLMMMPVNNISDVITPVLHPIFSEFQNDIQFIKDRYFKFLHIVSYISFPLSVFLYFVSREAILIVYGDNWEPAIRPFQILSLTVCSQMLLSSSGSIFMAVNATKRFFLAGCLCSFFMVSSFAISLFICNSINSIAWGFLCAQILNTITSFYILNHELKARLNEFLFIIARPVLFASIIAVVLYFVSIHTSFNVLVSFVFKLSIYGLLMLMLMEFFSEYHLCSLLFSKIKRRIV